ncbi:hypothetical protein HDV05_000865 [Chytridiales sp. JEL 0842]|nr:hypothetical protein HDV05_000865 [Chytridiales sp. JEL 0842]
MSSDSIKVTPETIILHHYPFSPYAQKITYTLSLLRLPFVSLFVSPVPPRPATQALAGGYRRIPVLQIGAEVFCDTGLILKELERRFSKEWERGFGDMATTKGSWEGEVAGAWCDKVLFGPTSSLLPFETLPTPLRLDREKMQSLPPNSLLNTVPHRPFFRSQLLPSLVALETLLNTQDWVSGRKGPGVSDVHAFMNPWFLSRMMKKTESFWFNESKFPQIFAWMGRLTEEAERRGREVEGWKGAGVGVGKVKDIEALEAAKSSTLGPLDYLPPQEEEDAMSLILGIKVGDVVRVAPADYGKVDVEGVVEYLSSERVVLRRKDAEYGVETRVHFPVRGYRIRVAKESRSRWKGAGVGVGKVKDIEALEAAKSSTLGPLDYLPPQEEEDAMSLILGIKVGDVVRVAPADYGKVDVEGVVEYLSSERVVLRRKDAEYGVETRVHFPVRGYRIRVAQESRSSKL